jgi:hypothetical protein
MPTTRPGFIWSGTEWVAIGQEAVVNPFYYQATAPTGAATGAIWIESDVDVPSIDSSQFLRWRDTAVGGETSLSGVDDLSLPLQYTPGYEQLYINGVLQVRGQDYTATTGTTVTGLTALVANDVVEIFSAVARTVADVYTQTQSDTRFGNSLRTSQLMFVRDEKGGAGGAFNSGAWRTRDLNTVKTNNITGASLASNQITLPTGTYWLEANAPAHRVNRHIARLYNVTDAALLALGTSEYAEASYNVSNSSTVNGLFTISGTKVIELQHYSEASLGTYGFGVESPTGTSVFSQVKLWKVA